MLPLKNLVLLISVASVLGQQDPEDALQYDFSFMVRVLGWAKSAQLYKITYRAREKENALAIADFSNQNLNIYNFANWKSHFKIDGTSCNIIKIHADVLKENPVFPIILTENGGLLRDASCLLRLDGEKEAVGQDAFQNTETFKLKEPKEIEINEVNDKKKYSFTITVTRMKANNPEDRYPVSVKAESGEKTITYEIFDFSKDITDDDFKVPDGYYCMTKEDDATPLPEYPLITPSRLQFTRRGEDKSVRGWIDSRFGVRKEEVIGRNLIHVTDMANDVEYKIDKTNGKCSFDVLESKSQISPGDFLYSLDSQSKMQLLKEDVTVGTMRVFVLATSLANIFLTGQPGDPSAVPLKVTTRSPTGEVTVEFIEGFSSEVSWEEFDVSQCLAPQSSEVFRIFFAVENNTLYGNSFDFQYQLLGLLMEWTGVKEPLRFTNLQPYGDGSFSCTILPARKNSTEPKSLEVVQKIVALVKAGNAIITKPDNSHSRIGLVTYETLGAPQATYRSVSVFWISFSVSILSLLLGLLLALVFIRQTSSTNYIRRQLGV